MFLTTRARDGMDSLFPLAKKEISVLERHAATCRVWSMRAGIVVMGHTAGTGERCGVQVGGMRPAPWGAWIARSSFWGRAARGDVLRVGHVLVRVGLDEYRDHCNEGFRPPAFVGWLGWRRTLSDRIHGA